VHVPTETAYPLSVIVAGAAALELRVTFDARYFTADSAREMANGLREALSAIAHAAPGASVADVLARLREPTIAVGGAARTGELVAPRTATESVLAAVWGEVLGIEHVGVTDDFFALGGYSLVATQIASRIRGTLQVDVPVRLLFQHPTVARLADALKSRERKPGQLERIAQVVQRVSSMSLDEVRHARAERAGIN
jgi:phosphopantetheine binding protein